MNPNASPYEILGLEPGHTQAELKKAYALKLKAHRPDRDPTRRQPRNEGAADLTHTEHDVRLPRAHHRGRSSCATQVSVGNHVERVVTFPRFARRMPELLRVLMSRRVSGR